MAILERPRHAPPAEATERETSTTSSRSTDIIDWQHLLRMTDGCGLLEHATGAVPNRRHGYCTDDNGRALAVVARGGNLQLRSLAESYLAFLEHAHLDHGHFALRMTYDRRWRDEISDDASGRG